MSDDLADLPKHTRNGNCFALAYKCTRRGCTVGTLCDVCHLHEAPRGDCDECVGCQACEEEGANV